MTIVKSSSLKVFADDVSIYAKVSSIDDCLKLQDLFRIYQWSVSWQMTLNPHKCEAIDITNKRSPVFFTYCVGEHRITWASY